MDDEIDVELFLEELQHAPIGDEDVHTEGVGAAALPDPTTTHDEDWRWSVVRTCLQGKPLYDHHLQSYNDFISHGLQTIIDEDPVLEVTSDSTPGAARVDGRLRQARIRFGKISVGKPRIREKPLKAVATIWEDIGASGKGWRDEPEGDNGGFESRAGLDSDPVAGSGDDGGWGAGKNASGSSKTGDWGQSVGWGNETEGAEKTAPSPSGWGNETEGAEKTAPSSSGWGTEDASNARQNSWMDGWGDNDSTKVGKAGGNGNFEFDEIAFGAGGAKVVGEQASFGAKASDVTELGVDYGQSPLKGKASLGNDAEEEDDFAKAKAKGKMKLHAEDEAGTQGEGMKVMSGGNSKSGKGDVSGVGKKGHEKTGKKRKSRRTVEDSDSEAEAVDKDIFPREARLRKLTYAADIFIDIKVDIYVPVQAGITKDGSAITEEKLLETKDHVKYPVGKIPVMIRSNLCHLHKLGGKRASKEDCAYDVGGYFIISGSEKVLLAQEKQFAQRITVSQNNLGLTASSAGSYYKDSNRLSRTSVYLRKEMVKKDNVRADGAHVCTVGLWRAGLIPIVVVMRALGVENDKEMLEMICGDLQDRDVLELGFAFVHHADKEMEGFVQERRKSVKSIYKQKAALKFIGSKVKSRKDGQTEVESAVLALSNLFPGQDGLSDSARAFVLGYMALRLCYCHLGRCEVDDRDNLRNKRLDLSGDLLSLEFRDLWRRFKNELRRRTQKSLAKRKIDIQLDLTTITVGFQVAFSTGKWSTRRNRDDRDSGVVAELPRTNPMKAIAQLRKLRTPVTYSAKAAKVRYIHDSHRHKVCILETPDGEDCGLLKSLALSCVVSSETPEEQVYTSLLSCQMRAIDTLTTLWLRAHATSQKVFLNGKWVGSHPDPASLVREMRSRRREGNAMVEVEIVHDTLMREVRVYSDAGRFLRPLLVVESNRVKMSSNHLTELRTGRESGLQYLLKEGVLEFVGVEEEEGALIASNTKELEKAQKNPFQASFTHLELHDMLLVGLGASVIPFFNHNQCTRDMQQAQKHGKQAIGHYVMNRHARFDTSGHELFYPQNQLVRTGAAASLQKDELVNGQNAIVAVACYSGFNQEDSLIMNKSSLDRGLFRTVHYKTHRSKLKREMLEDFRKPCQTEDKVVPKKVQEAYDMVDGDGFAYVGARLDDGDIICNKARPDKTIIGQAKDVLEKATLENRGRVDQVMQTTEKDGTRIANVRMRSCRRPEIGDKFSSMHGQKGILAMVFDQEDMLFTKEGIVPDIIINPHAFPSRQTLGQLMESILGKAVATPPPSHDTRRVGRNDATPFANSLSYDAIFQELHKSGYQMFGKESMSSGHTGRRMDALITIGPTFYQRLTHLVVDKVKFRGLRGYVHPLTRQPVKQREKHGAVKFGVMEQDCMMAHGAAMTVRERTFLQSDYYKMFHCKRCQLPAFVDRQTEIASCRVCRSPQHVVQLEVPYACKLLQQELFSMGIALKLVTESS